MSPRRADAQRNRERILASARLVFRESGPDASLDRIALQAGVGNATLYRHFPNREALRSAVLSERMLEVEAALTALEAESDEGYDAGGTVERYVRFLAALPDNSLIGVLLTAPEVTPDVRELRERIRHRVHRLIERAHSAGALRDDYTVDDMNVFLFSHAKAATSPLISAAAAETLLEDYLAGIRRVGV